MKRIVNKYKYTIIYWLIFLAIILYFVPKQNDYYLYSDIRDFKTKYFNSILILTGIILCLALLIFLLLDTKSIKTSIIPFLSGMFVIAFLFFIYQDVFLAGALFINRQFKRSSLEKAYVVKYPIEVHPTKYNFIVFDVAAKQFTSDEKLFDRLYQPQLKQNDTILMKFNTGLWGIPYIPE